MTIQEWNADLHTPVLRKWAGTDDTIRKLLGGIINEESLDATMPERGMVFNDEGEPVAVVGMQMLGTKFAHVHVIAEPTEVLSLSRTKDISRAYDISFDTARERGVKVLHAVIPAENEPALKMAVHKGFKPLPIVQMIKVLGGNGNGN